MSDSGVDPIPAEKLAAQKAQVFVDPNSIQFGSSQPKAALENRGPTGDLAILRTRVPELLTASAAVGRMPSALSARSKEVSALADTRKAKLSTIWAPEDVDREAKDLESGLADASSDPSYRSYTSNDFIVTSWQGQQVDGNTATMQVLGHMTYSNGNEKWQEPEYQYEVHLVRIGGQWVLDSVTSVRADGEQG